ncbi:glycosyltransferase family 4 protein [Candidatus Halobonum tyrrellensis]|uniref:Sugar transferase n=1 Tax=Candidatus Halobonum tyrrellensis G22 TaxID=1324957 RepID=V4HGE6_9EURY|nr:glycosyltransferase family 4 protein [Candidatus Halobonum tyrrellensis]ESP89188.1 sugar transferase [Candidatus Halobonum tyrrellensis G22]
MRVLNYLELDSRLDRAGIGTAHDQQVKALSRAAAAGADVEVVTSPWRDGDPVGGLRGALGGRDPLVDYDVAHCNLVGPASVALARHAKYRDRPLVLHCHVTSEDFRESFRGSNTVAPALRRYLRWFYSQADLVLCPSEYTERRLADYPVEAPVRAMSNGVDLGSIAGHERLRERYRERYGIDGTAMFAVGSVFERKGLTDFCEVAKRSDHEFVWFGTVDSGPQASSTVRRWTRDPPENVTFTGWVDEKAGAFGAGDVFFFPTKVENQGLVVLEAMACGKACVLRDIPVFREYFEDGHDCLLRSTREGFAEALDSLAADETLRERLGANARETAATHSLDRVGEQLVGVYEDLLARRDATGSAGADASGNR